MKVDYIIVGQGLCGSLLSWYLHREEKTVLVIDPGGQNSASMVAAGVINPVTGRRYVASWMVEELLAFAKPAYEALGEELGIPLIVRRDLIDFFPSAQMRDAFVARITEDDTYLHTYPDQNHFNQYFHYDFGSHSIEYAYLGVAGVKSYKRPAFNSSGAYRGFMVHYFKRNF